MASIVRTILSGSTDGRQIKVTATATPGTTIHTAHGSSEDEIWLWVGNEDSVARDVTIEFGGTTDPDDRITYSVPPGDGLKLMIPGLTLTNSLVVKAFAAAANVIMVAGHVNRITP